MSTRQSIELKKFISICIPSYNRSMELKKLLYSIDHSNCEEIEIVICEDKSPLRKKIRKIVQEYILNSNYKVRYFENEENIGYDKNIKELIKKAIGEYVIFMGDDDEFVKDSLSKYINFLKNNRNLGYMLKTSRIIKNDKSIEEFRYYGKTKFFEPGYNAYIALFRKSVFISGFTFKRKYSLPYLSGHFDGTLLIQLYILAEIVLKYPSAYCDILLTQQYEGGKPFFGSSEVEKEFYTPGTITINNSLNFMSGYFKITNFLDKKYNFNSTKEIKIDISKYSYPILSIQREKGIKEFIRYYRKLKELDINITIYYHIYFLGLLIIGKKYCDKLIQAIKKKLGRTPKL